MIRHFYIDNFKSLVDFHLPPEPAGLAKFTCLIGPNGSGKSTVLQAFDFIKQLMYGRMDDWLEARGWKVSELKSRLSRKQLIHFRVNFQFPEIGEVVWEGVFNPGLLRCTLELVHASGKPLLRFGDGSSWYASEKDGESVEISKFEFQGSVLSSLKVLSSHPAIRAVKYFVREWKSLDMLAPNLMRKRSRDAEDIGHGGERLSAFLHKFSKSDRERVAAAIRNFYPWVSNVETTAIRSGWKDLKLVEKYTGSEFFVSARHLNDGMLRILAIVSQIEVGHEARNIPHYRECLRTFEELGASKITLDEYRTLLFDEIENGIHPELIEKLVAYLLQAQQQIIVTTHSPMILNYLPDEVAKEAVILLYRTPEGITRSVRYFDLPSARKKLDLLGPGEVFVDTDLSTLTQEAEELRTAPK